MAEPGSCDDIGCTVYRPQDFVDGPPRPMSREPGRPVVIAGLVLVAFVLGLVSAAPAGARPQAHARHLTRSFRDRSMSRARTRTITPARPLVFGIYPGGAAGTVGPAGQLQPEDPVKRLAALEQLRPPGRRSSYTCTPAIPAPAATPPSSRWGIRSTPTLRQGSRSSSSSPIAQPTAAPLRT